jgi:hypothetical protein
MPLALDAFRYCYNFFCYIVFSSFSRSEQSSGMEGYRFSLLESLPSMVLIIVFFVKEELPPAGGCAEPRFRLVPATDLGTIKCC